MSIAAVDDENEWAPFSNYNEHVTMSAVGVDVFSTYPLPSDGTTVEIVSPSGTFTGFHMVYSKYAGAEGVTGFLADCRNGGKSCSGPGHVCVFERNGASFHAKVLQCENSGGVAAIIYSDDNSDVHGTMGAVNNSPKFTSIPAVGVKRDVGLQLLQILGQEVTLSTPLEDGYGSMSGTSMA